MSKRPGSAHHRLHEMVNRSEFTGCLGTAPVHFARAVLNLRPAGVDCDVCGAALPGYVEAELNNSCGPLYRTVRHHIDLCPACCGLYLDLLEVALLAEEGPLPAPPLRIDLSFLEPPAERSACDVQ